MFLLFIFSQVVHSGLIAYKAQLGPFPQICGTEAAQTSCCMCSNQAKGCNSTTNLCQCTASANFGRTCLLSQSEYTTVYQQYTSGADETVLNLFSIPQLYELVKYAWDQSFVTNSSISLTQKQITQIQTIAQTQAQSNNYQSEMYWYMKIVNYMTPLILKTSETANYQTLQMNQIETIRQLMFKMIYLDPLGLPYTFQSQYYSGYIQKWRSNYNLTNMTFGYGNFSAASCEYKWRSVLIQYKIVMAINSTALSSFTNSTFVFNSTPTYCNFMDKTGSIYYPPTSEFYYQTQVPPFTYEKTLLGTSGVSALICYQVQSGTSGYSMLYDNQQCQYKASTTTTYPYCQCNQPGLVMVQAQYTTSFTLKLMFIFYSIILII